MCALTIAAPLRCWHPFSGCHLQDNKPKQAASQLLPSEAVQHWFARKLSFREASSEQKMLWRRDLPEYHKGLVGGCRLLVKPLPQRKAVAKPRSKTA